MNEKIELSVTYTAEDYARGLKYIQRRNFFVRYKFLLPVIVVLGALVFTYISNPDKFLTAYSRPGNIIVILFPFVILLPIFYFLGRKKSSFFVRKQYEKQINSSPILQEPKIIVFDEEGIKGQQGLGSSETTWDGFIEAAETEDDFYFFTAKKVAQFIPKRDFRDEFQQNQLRELIKRKLDEKAKF